jgi:hypothetical protein
MELRSKSYCMLPVSFQPVEHNSTYQAVLRIRGTPVESESQGGRENAPPSDLLLMNCEAVLQAESCAAVPRPHDPVAATAAAAVVGRV